MFQVNGNHDELRMIPDDYFVFTMRQTDSVLSTSDALPPVPKCNVKLYKGNVVVLQPINR